MNETHQPTHTTVASLLCNHFGTSELHKLVVASRTFPVTSRLDLQTSLLGIIDEICDVLHQSGVHAPYSFESLSFNMMTIQSDHAPSAAPIEYQDVDIGETAPVRCLKSTLWLCVVEGRKVAILLAPHRSHGEVGGWNVELAGLPKKNAADANAQVLAELEHRISRAQSYRGKVISLERRDNYSGKAGSVRVHKLRGVSRDQVILPEKTLRLLERNVTEFIAQRDNLKALGMSVKKGLLFYGPPGTGKTHTIHYLASQLRDHTTLLITAEEVAMLDQYFQLARFLQPAMIVLEDVDLIARARTNMHGPCEESLLNKLLNEMDGLREDAELLFVLTTNRPNELEAALAARPGRIDQAIEFPLPDDEGRRKLVKLYAGKLKITAPVVEVIVKKTKNASAAFIKELMRRAAQVMLRSAEKKKLRLDDVESALDEMLFTGGSLNMALLGGEA